MVTLVRPRCAEKPRQFMQGTRLPNISGISSSTEFRVITLQDPVVDPEWIFHHPRFRSETETSPQSKRLFHAKRVYSRVPSATGNARSKLLCERRERDQGNSTGRHFCELLGPNLCKECWKLAQRTDAFKEHRDSCPREFKSCGKDAFSAMIAAREKRIEHEYNDSDEEILVENEDEEFIFKSFSSRKARSMSPQDSGYSSRVSYIRSLSRSPSGEFCPRVTSRSKVSRGALKTPDDEKDIPANQRRPSKVETTPIWENAYLAKLRERETFREVLTKNLRYPRKVRHAWRDLPVAPIVMDLKLINFTIYDSARLNERADTINTKE